MAASLIDYDFIFTPIDPQRPIGYDARTQRSHIFDSDPLISRLDLLFGELDNYHSYSKVEGLSGEPPHGIERFDPKDVKEYYIIDEPAGAWVCLGKLNDDRGGYYFYITATIDGDGDICMDIKVSLDRIALFKDLNSRDQELVIQVKTAEAANAKRLIDEAAAEAADEAAYYDMCFTRMKDPHVDCLPFSKLDEFPIRALPGEPAHGIERFNPDNITEYYCIGGLAEELLCLGKLNDSHYFSLIVDYKTGEFQGITIHVSKNKGALFENLPDLHKEYVNKIRKDDGGYAAWLAK